MNDEPTVFVVDDDPDVLNSVRWLIESVGLDVETYDSADSFLKNYDNERPGCLVLDVRMPGMSGLELQAHLRGAGIDIPIVVVTAHGDVPMAVRAMKSGAVDFVEKPVNDQLLLDRIQLAIAKDVQQREHHKQQQAVQERMNRLTTREGEVMQFVVQGMTSREIAERLGVSFKTIEAHRAKIMKKMEAKSVPQLVQMKLSLSPRP